MFNIFLVQQSHNFISKEADTLYQTHLFYLSIHYLHYTTYYKYGFRQIFDIYLNPFYL